MNKGSTEDRDKVIITSKESCERVDILSYKEVALSNGEFYRIKKFGGSSLTLTIEVNDVSLDSMPAYADISVSLQDRDSSNKQMGKNDNKKKKSKTIKKNKKKKRGAKKKNGRR